MAEDTIALRAGNTARWAVALTQGHEESRATDSSMKNNLRLVNKCRTVDPTNLQEILDELPKLSIDRYIPDLVLAISAAIARPRMPTSTLKATIKLSSVLHLQLDPASFGAPLLIKLVEVVSVGEDIDEQWAEKSKTDADKVARKWLYLILSGLVPVGPLQKRLGGHAVFDTFLKATVDQARIASAQDVSKALEFFNRSGALLNRFAAELTPDVTKPIRREYGKLVVEIARAYAVPLATLPTDIDLLLSMEIMEYNSTVTEVEENMASIQPVLEVYGISSDRLKIPSVIPISWPLVEGIPQIGREDAPELKIFKDFARKVANKNLTTELAQYISRGYHHKGFDEALANPPSLNVQPIYSSFLRRISKQAPRLVYRVATLIASKISPENKWTPHDVQYLAANIESGTLSPHAAVDSLVLHYRTFNAERIYLISQACGKLLQEPNIARERFKRVLGRIQARKFSPAQRNYMGGAFRYLGAVAPETDFQTRSPDTSEEALDAVLCRQQEVLCYPHFDLDKLRAAIAPKILEDVLSDISIIPAGAIEVLAAMTRKISKSYPEAAVKVVLLVVEEILLRLRNLKPSFRQSCITGVQYLAELRRKGLGSDALLYHLVSWLLKNRQLGEFRIRLTLTLLERCPLRPSTAARLAHDIESLIISKGYTTIDLMHQRNGVFVRLKKIAGPLWNELGGSDILSSELPSGEQTPLELDTGYESSPEYDSFEDELAAMIEDENEFLSDLSNQPLAPEQPSGSDASLGSVKAGVVKMPLILQRQL